MRVSEFHEKKSERFIEESPKDGLEEEELLLRFKTDITQENSTNPTNDEKETSVTTWLVKAYNVARIPATHSDFG